MTHAKTAVQTDCQYILFIHYPSQHLRKQICGRRRHRYTLVEEAISCIWLLKDSGYILPLLQILLMPQEKKKRYTAQLCVLQATRRIYSRKRTENYVPLVLVQLPSVRWRLFRHEDSRESWFLAVSSSSSPAKYTIAATPHTHTHTYTWRTNKLSQFRMISIMARTEWY